MGIFNLLIEKIFYTNEDLKYLSGIDFLGKGDNFLLSNYFKRLSFNHEKKYYEYGKRAFGIWWLIYTRNNQIIEVYLDRIKLDNDQFSIVQKNHYLEIKKYGLVEILEKPHYASYRCYENEKYQIVIDKDRIVIRDVVGRIV